MADVQAVPAPRFGRWLVETSLVGVIGGIVCWFLDKMLLVLLVPDGAGPFGLFAIMIALGCVALLGGIVIVVQASAWTRLGAGSAAAWRTAAAVCVVGWLPWFGPDEIRLGLTFRLAIGPALLAGTVWFVAVAVAVGAGAAPAVAPRSVRRTAVAALAVSAALWLPVHDAVISSASATALNRRSVPRSSALTVSWPGYLPEKYLRVSDDIRLQYDLATGFPCPGDCGSAGVLTVGPATTSPCGLPMAIADSGSTAPPTDCRQIAPGTWSRQTPDRGCDVIELSDARTIQIYEDDCPATSVLLHILGSLRPADSAEILSRT
jgi:hypothetical protein